MALAVLVIGVVIALAATPRSDLPAAVRVAKDHVDSVLNEAGPRAEWLVQRAERALHEVRDWVGVPMARASRSTVSGSARVVDGDTLDVGAVRIRLHGVDSPESRQSCVAGGRRWACGERATRALAGRIGGRTVACEERDRYGRIVAVCRDGGEDVNAWMVSQGWGLTQAAPAHRLHLRPEPAGHAGPRRSGARHHRSSVRDLRAHRLGLRRRAALP